MSTDDNFALFLDPSGRGAVQLRVGESHDGWVLRSVSVRDVLLQNGRASAVLALPSAERGESAPVQARAPVAGATRVAAEHIVVPRRAAPPALDYADH
ncbi:hypothetical protein ABLE93_25590 [Xanthobacter sp. KR7-65]|uniref:hypothetical protein n=1 Tax=Xanthobacter sp. KR7-65 TaxID=3156612 RepID=UPI0032B456CD